MNTVTYGIQGLCSSHTAVLRSMILLSEKSVACAWQATPESNADVLFLGPDANPEEFYPYPGQILVSLGDSPAKQSLHLDLPLLFPRVAKLLSHLTQDALAEQAQRPNEQTGLMPSIWNLGLLPPDAKHIAQNHSSGQLYKLKTWPPAGVIGSNRSYMRAAAVLTGKSLTSRQLAEKTSLPLEDCREFLGKLGQSQCLNITPPGSTPDAPGLAPTAGQNTMPTPRLSPGASSAQAAGNTASSAEVGLGLLGRIRSRLGFLGKAAT